MQSPNRPKPNSSIPKAVILLVFLVLILALYTILTRRGLPSGIADMVNSDFENYQNITAFDSTKSEQMKKVFAGFWEYSYHSEKIKKTDRIEIKDNGITWQVTEWFVILPDGDTVRYAHGSHGYLKPYAYFPKDTNLILCEYRTIRQVYVKGKDTCYGESQVDEVWRTRKFGETLWFKNRLFKPYNAELSGFFPEGMVDVVDELHLERCHHSTTLSFLATDTIRSIVQDTSIGSQDASYIQQLINAYYVPAGLSERIRFSNIELSKIPESTNVKLRIQNDGTLTEIRPVNAGTFITTDFKTFLIEEMNSWRVPELKEAEMIEQEYTIDLSEISRKYTKNEK